MIEQEERDFAEVKRLVASCAGSLCEIAEQLRELSRASVKQRLGSPHLRVSEAAAYLSIRPETRRRKLRNGQLPFHRRPGSAPYLLKHEIDPWLADPECFHPEETSKRRPPKIDQELVRRLLAGAKPP